MRLAILLALVPALAFGQGASRSPAQASLNFAGALYTTSAGQSLTLNQWTIINFGTLVKDMNGSGGTSVTTGASWHYTAPTSALYEISAAVAPTVGAAAGEAAIAVYVNGVAARRGNDMIWSGLGAGLFYPSGLVVPTVVYLTAGDSVDIRVYTTNGSNALVADATRNYVFIHRIPGS